MPVKYPDWKPGETLVVRRWLLKETDRGTVHRSYKEVRDEVLKEYGKIFEDVVEQSKAELLGWAYFRVPIKNHFPKKEKK